MGTGWRSYKGRRGSSKKKYNVPRYWGKYRLKLIERMGGKCVDCGESDLSKLVVHHESYSPEVRVLLCKDCHLERHKRKRRDEIRESLVG